MRRGMVHAQRGHPRFLSTPALPSALACILVSSASSVATRSACAQDMASNPRASPVTPRGAPPEEPPILTAHPDVAVREGGISLGTAGKLIVAQRVGISRHLHSTLDGAVALESPGEMHRHAEPRLRKGFVRWELRSQRGYRGEIGLQGDPASRTLHGGLEAPLPLAVHFNAFGQTHWTRGDRGGARIDYGNVGLYRRLSERLVVQPGLYVVDVHAQNDVRWIGANLRVECRGVEFFMNNEGARGRRFSTRKTWQLGKTCFTLGGQLQQRPMQANQRLFECGVIHERVGFRAYPGDDQGAILLLLGPLQIGFSQRPALRQAVFGVGDFSLSVVERENGVREVGFGFVFGGFLRRLLRTPGGWRLQQPLPRSAIDEPHLRWPGLASL